MSRKYKIGDEVTIRSKRRDKYSWDIGYSVGTVVDILKSDNIHKGNCIYLVKYKHSERLYRLRSYDLCLYEKPYKCKLEEHKKESKHSLKHYPTSVVNPYEWTFTSTIGTIHTTL